MWKTRILFALWLVLAVLFRIRSGSSWALLLLLLSVLVPLAGILLTALAAGTPEASVTVAVTCGKGEFAEGKVRLRSTSFLPLARVDCVLFTENYLTGERGEEVSLRFRLPIRGSAEKPVELQCASCGKLGLFVKELKIYDPFCLTAHRRDSSAAAELLVYPELFGMEAEIIYGESLSLDSDLYSMHKPGSDSSETFAIREYKQGDRIRQIHWKLSEKTGDLLVRDYGLPIQNSVLLALENAVPEEAPERLPEKREALAEAMLSLSQSLAEKQTVHSLAWYNYRTETFELREVTDETDLLAVLPDLLGAAPGKDTDTVMDHFMEAREQCAFAHIAVFTVRRQPELSAFAERALLTEVICEDRGTGPDMDGGIRIMSIDAENSDSLLRFMEL